MKAKVFSYKNYIGDTKLKVADASMGVYSGQFIPNKAYKKQIQKRVQKHNEALYKKEPDFKEWESLRLNIQLKNGLFLFPRGGYEIYDYEELKDEPLAITIAGVCTDFLCSSFELIEPWYTLSIREKLALEEELIKELNEDHELFHDSISAFCRNGSCDDVLFEIKKKGSLSQFALVHLTWSAKKEQDSNFPWTTLYDDFKEFAKDNM